MTVPDWWYVGFFATFIIFFCLMMLALWAMLRWGQKQVDKLDLEIHELEEAQRMFEQDLRLRWGDETHE